MASPTEAPHTRHVYTYFVVRLANRDVVQEEMKKAGVDTVIHYPIPLHLQPAYASLGYGEGDFPVAEAQARQILSLPLYPELTESQIRRIAQLALSV